MFDSTKIWKYLQQHLNDKEMAAVELWINASDSNREEFYENKRIWEAANDLDDILEVEDNWDEFEKLISDQTNRSRVINLGWIKYAASILLIASFILWFYLPKEEALYKTHIATSQNELLNLPDGSSIILDSASSVQYYTRIDKDLALRKIFMKGGAKFDIAKYDSLPFLVELDKTGIEVLGTVFIVKEIENENISVENIDGLIKFFELANVDNAITLKKGQIFSFDGSGFKNEKKITKADSRKLYTVEKIIEILFEKFDGKFNTGAYGYFDLDAKIRLDLEKSLEVIISQIEQQAIVEYKKTCPDCFEINSIRSK